MRRKTKGAVRSKMSAHCDSCSWPDSSTSDPLVQTKDANGDGESHQSWELSERILISRAPRFREENYVCAWRIFNTAVDQCVVGRLH